MLRSCYTTTGRLYQGGPPVTIRWYFADEDAPIYDGFSCWEPELYWRGWSPRPDEPGELPGAKRYWYNGANPGIVTQPHWCGAEEDFRGNGTAPILPNGRPDFARLCSCSTPPCIGWGPTSISPASYHGTLRLEAPVTPTVVQGMARDGELWFEGVWSLVAPPALAFVGELHYEGEYSVRDFTLIHADGELFLEGEVAEGDTSIRDYAGELVFDGEFVAGTADPAAGEGELYLEGECEEHTTDGVEAEGELYLEGEATVDVFPDYEDGELYLKACWDEGPFAAIDEAEFDDV